MIQTGFVPKPPVITVFFFPQLTLSSLACRRVTTIVQAGTIQSSTGSDTAEERCLQPNLSRRLRAPDNCLYFIGTSIV